MGRILLTGELQLINREYITEIEKSPLEDHSNNCCMQDSLMDAKLSWQKSDDKQGIQTISVFLHQAIDYTGNSNFTVGTPGIRHLNQVMKRK